MKGTVINWRPSRAGFGFIKTQDGESFYFNESDIDDQYELSIGDEVSFEPVVPEPARGPRARAVIYHDHDQDLVEPA